MAASVDAVFRIIDRASAPLRRMQRQADQTDRAIARLAMTTDSVGSVKQQRNITASERALRSYGGEVDRMGSRTRSLTRDMDQHIGRWGRLRTAMVSAFITLRSIGGLLSTLKFPAIGVGVGVLAQAIGALSGGVIALLPRIADLGGAFAALPATIAGAGLAMVTIKLATNDLSKALSGNKNALKALTPEARRFVTTLKEYGPVLTQIRRTAQQGLFPGLDYSLRRLQRAVPMVQRLVGAMGRHIGAAASRASDRFTTPGFLQDFEGIGRQGIQMFDRFASALVNVIDGLRHLTMAARPFTEWIGTLITRFGVWFRNWAQFQRDSGRFAAFLTRTRSSMTLFARILRNVWDFFTALGRAARPLGDMLWRDAERATRAWAKYSNSVAGQLRLTRQFLSMHDAIQNIVTLFDNLVRAIFRMGSSQQLPGIVKTLDTMIPALERLFNLFVSTFGPATARLLSELTRTLTFIVSATGPLNIMLTLLTNILKLFNDLVDSVPGLGRVLSTALSVVTIGLFINKVRTLAASWWGVVAGARAAAGAEAMAMGGGVAGRGGRGGPIMLGGPGIGGMGRAAAGASRFGRLGGLAAGLGRAAWPVAAAFGAFGALSAPRSGGFLNQFVQTQLGATNALTFGLAGRIPAPGPYSNLNDAFATPGQRADKRLQGYQTQLQAGLSRFGGANPTTLPQLQGSVRYLGGIHPAPGTATRPDVVALMTTVREEIRVRRILLGTLVREKNQRDRALGTQRVRQLGQAYDIYAKRFGAHEALYRTGGELATQMESVGPAGRRVLGQAALSWAKEMEKQGRPGFKGATNLIRQIVEGSFTQMHDHVKVINNRIFTGTQAEWNRIKNAIANPAEKARQAAFTAFTAIQNKALGALQAMGFTAGEARKLVAGMESTGVVPGRAPVAGMRTADDIPGARGRATGGRIWAAGGDMGDSVSLGGGMLGGKGELVVNQHTERKVNYLLGGRTTLGGLVANEGRAHGHARGGRASGLQAGIAGIAGDVLSHFPGLAITSTTGGRHAKNSYHYRGMAVDIGGSSTLMNAAAQWIGSTIGRSLLEGIHNPNLSIKNGAAVAPSFWGPQTWAGHRDHIHLAAAGGGPAGGVAGMPGGLGGAFAKFTAGQLRPRPSMIGGVPGALADQAGLLMATGMASHLNQSIAGGKAPWFKDGGDFIARKPMVIGVGDTEEHVAITPTHRRTRGGRPIVLQVHIGKIENHRDGDIRKIVHDEFDKLADDLALTMFVGDEETIR